MKMDECVVWSVPFLIKPKLAGSLWLCACVCSFIEIIPHIFLVLPFEFPRNNTHIEYGVIIECFMEWATVIVWIRHTRPALTQKREIYQFQFEFQAEKPFVPIRTCIHIDLLVCCFFFALLSDSKSLLYSYAILEFYFSFNFDLGCSIEENHKSHMQQVFERANIRCCRFFFFFSPSLPLSSSLYHFSPFFSTPTSAFITNISCFVPILLSIQSGLLQNFHNEYMYAVRFE